MNLAPRGAAADDKESIALRPSFLGVRKLSFRFYDLTLPPNSARITDASPPLSSRPEARVFCGSQWRDRGEISTQLRPLRSSLLCFSPLLNFPHVLSASGPAPRQHSPPPHQISRPRLSSRSPHQPFRGTRPRSHVGPLFRRRQMGQWQTHTRHPSYPRRLFSRPQRSHPLRSR